VPIIDFKRIAVNRDDNLTSTRTLALLKLNFCPPKSQDHYQSPMLFLMFLQVYARLFNATSACDLVAPQDFAAAVQDVVIVVRAKTPLTSVQMY